LLWLPLWLWLSPCARACAPRSSLLSWVPSRPVVSPRAGSADDGCVPELLTYGGFGPLRATTVSHGVATGSLPAQFHVTFGVPVLRGFGNRKREFLWPDEADKAQVLGEECLGRRALLYNMTPTGMTVTAVRIARFECVHYSARALVPAMCVCVCVCVRTRVRVGGLSAVTCLPWQQRHERALCVQRGDG
jgi:hypothetical protein